MILGSLPAKRDQVRIIIRSLLLLIIGLRRHCRVVGHSMRPTINEGDFLIYKPFRAEETVIKKGSLVIIKNPTDPKTLIVKRVFDLNLKGIEVRGDNDLISIDSRQFGLINYIHVEGVVEHIVTKFL